ncbi:MAG: hypothetical protein ACTSQF_08110 [Candidatus Heimdallarchaeaceae archaeon]
MVIIVPKNAEGLFMIVVGAIAIAAFFSPLLLTAGIAALITEEVGFGGSITMTVLGSLLYIGILFFTIFNDVTKRKKGENTGFNFLIATFAGFGVVEIIFAFVFVGNEFVYIMLLAGACVSVAPMILYGFPIWVIQKMGKLNTEIKDTKFRRFMKKIWG